MNEQVLPAEGRLGILMPGLGAVATTFIAGVEAVKKGSAQPIGSLTQMASIRVGKRTENKNPKVKDFVPLADINDIAFGGWDVYADNVYQAAIHADVLDKYLLETI
ncbi:MAG TPA: inositol-3-phosphate synthase, partial [Segetibacter sp.]